MQKYVPQTSSVHVDVVGQSVAWSATLHDFAAKLVVVKSKS